MSLRGLAACAGVSKTAPYRHFANKGELLVTLAAEGFGALADELEAALRGGGQGKAASMRQRTGFAPVSAYLGFARSVLLSTG